MARTQLLRASRVVTPEGVLRDAWVQIADARIVSVGSERPPIDAAFRDLADAWLLPGYIDLHMHGGGGHGVADSLESMDRAVAYHRGTGTTASLVSLMAAPEEALSDQLGWAAELAQRGPTPPGRVLGSHLEGPFLSARRTGAQNAAYLTSPDAGVLGRLQDAARGTLRIVTIAPELEGALPLIGMLGETGVIAAMGHSDASYEQGLAAIRAGASHTTHLFNAMRPLHHREPGLAGAALEAGLTCELINDGIHVHPAMVRLVFELIPHPVLVTDATAATGAGDGRFELGGQAVEVRGGVAHLAGTDTLAGSTLTMAAAVRRAVHASGISVERASAAASANPARVLGLEREIGSIAPGLCADLVVLDHELEVTDVMASGVWCPRTEKEPPLSQSAGREQNERD